MIEPIRFIRRLILYTVVCFSVLHINAANKIRVACLGDNFDYPVRLQSLLGEKYEVRDFGESGVTLLSKGNHPFMKTEAYKKAQEFTPEVAIFHLGVNDNTLNTWPNYKDDFIKDYLKLIEDIRAANQKVDCLIARITPVTNKHTCFLAGARDWHAEIQQAIELVAHLSGATLIDFHTPLYSKPFLLPDAVHPNEEGVSLLADVAYSAVTGDYGGLKMPMTYSDYMMLQYDRPICIHGVADADEKVVVKIAGQQKRTVANRQGKRQVVLDPLKAGLDYTLEISTMKQKQTYIHVAAGDVWLCGGQSNMAFMMKQTLDMKQGLVNPSIRLFDMKATRGFAPKPWSAEFLDSINHLKFFKPAVWKECTPETSAHFSAVAYHFGAMLQDSLQVPIGLICNAQRSSIIEAWIDRQTLEKSCPDVYRDFKNSPYVSDWIRTIF